MYMPVIHRAQIEHPKKNFKTVNLLPRSKSEFTTTDYVVLIVVIVLIVMPLAAILIRTTYHLIRRLHRPTGTSINGDRAPRKLGKRRSIKVRNQTLDFHHDRNEDNNSVNGNMPDDINLSLLSAGSAVVSTMPDDSPPGIVPSGRFQLEELEERVQKLEGRFNIVPSGSEEYQNDHIRAEDPLSDSEEEPLPPYTRLPASSESVVSASPGWKMIY